MPTPNPENYSAFLQELQPTAEQAEQRAAYLDSLDSIELATYQQFYDATLYKAAMWAMTERLATRDVTIATQAAELNRRQHILEAADDEIAFLEGSNQLDRLTGLGNRVRLERAYQNLMASTRLRRHGERPVGPTALMLDVDKFHDFNEAHGHPMGDVALRAVAARVREGIRATDTAGRYGGEEIAIFLDETTEEEAWLVADRIRTAIEETEIGPDRLHVTASFGIAPLDEAESFEAALVPADQALFAAKATGRNRIILASDLNPEV